VLLKFTSSYHNYYVLVRSHNALHSVTKLTSAITKETLSSPRNKIVCFSFPCGRLFRDLMAVQITVKIFNHTSTDKISPSSIACFVSREVSQ